MVKGEGNVLTSINESAARRLVQMELGEADHDFGFSVEDITDSTVVWRDFDNGNFYELIWTTSDGEPEFGASEGLIWCPQVVPEQTNELVWRKI